METSFPIYATLAYLTTPPADAAPVVTLELPDPRASLLVQSLLLSLLHYPPLHLCFPFPKHLPLWYTLPMASSNSSLPLHCSVCPRKPTFSDVSHLLTHVASKAHLSHYYKLKVRANEEVAAQAAIDQYDLWYSQYHVESLMSQRMRDKERKQARAQKQGNVLSFRSSTVPTHLPLLFADSSAQSVARLQNPSTKHVSDRPSLSNRQSVSARQSTVQHDATRIDRGVARVGAPLPRRQAHLHVWDTQRPYSYTASPLRSSTSPSDVHSSIETDNMDVQDGGTAISQDDTVKLKGEIYEGMDVFDSATPEMKRKRNQTKDASVLARLVTNSRRVLPTEVVYYSKFSSIKAHQEITGRPVSSSPEGEETPPPPPKRRGSRKVLRDKDANSSIAVSRQSRSRRLTSQSNAAAAQHNGTRRHHANSRFSELYSLQNEQPTDMTVLTSEFHPAPQMYGSINMSTQRGYAPASWPTYGTTDVFSMYRPAAFTQPPQSQYGRANPTYYGNNGYDLAAFFQGQFQEPPYAMLRQQQGTVSRTQTDSTSHGTADSPAESYAPPVSTPATSYAEVAEEQEMYGPADPSFFDETAETQLRPMSPFTDSDLELLDNANNHQASSHYQG